MPKLQLDGAGNIIVASASYLAKLAPDGSLIWRTNSDGSEVAALIADMAVDSAGNMVVTGHRATCTGQGLALSDCTSQITTGTSAK